MAGRVAAPELFTLELAALVHLIRWEWAMLMIEAGTTPAWPAIRAARR